MRCVGHESPSTGITPALEFEGKEQVSQLRLLVGSPGVVFALGLQIGEIDFPPAMRQAAHIHDSRRLGFAQQRQQQSGKSKVAKMIGSELQFEAVFR